MNQRAGCGCGIPCEPPVQLAAAPFAAHDTQRNEMRGAIKPAGKDGIGAERSGFVREQDEDRLGYFPRPVADRAPAGGRRNKQIDIVALHQGRKGAFGLMRGVFARQLQVIIRHPPYSCRVRGGKETNILGGEMNSRVVDEVRAPAAGSDASQRINRFSALFAR